MPVARQQFAEGAAARARRKKIELCKRDSWYLATEIMGRGFNPKLSPTPKGLTERVHKPIMRWYDRHKADPRIGIWMRRKFGHKTTMVTVWIIQHWLIDPSACQGYFHAVDEHAAAVLAEVKHFMQRCGRLRALDPVGIIQDPKSKDFGQEYRIFPGPTGKYGTAHTITIKNRERFSRFPSLFAKGTNSEVTGTHFDGPVWLDDIISRSTIINSQLAETARWYQNTILPVSDGIIRSTGTPWSDMSLHQEWMASKRWRTIVLPAAITETDEEFRRELESDQKKVHFAPDYKFTNPMFWEKLCEFEGKNGQTYSKDFEDKARDKLIDEESDMAGEFAPQIMCDAEPKKERFWSQSACEHFTGIQPRDGMIGITLPGVNVVLSDPAPYLLGSADSEGEKKRGDGSKDYWSIAVVRFVAHGRVETAILLDGDRSDEWTEKQGHDRIAALMSKWRTPYYVSEQPKQHFEGVRRSCMEIGTPCTVSRRGGPWIFDDYNRADGKNARFERLSAWARDGRFYICSETVPDEFLYGDQEHSGFLTQARKWRRTGKGKNSLRFDDDADVVARCTDGVLRNFTPRAATSNEDFFDQFNRDEDTIGEMRTRYMGM